MAINFPDSPTNGQSATLGGNTWTYNSTSGAWARAAAAGGSSITTYDSTTDLPLSGVSAGDQAFVTGSNRMYISNGTGWYSVSLVNTNPNITSVQDSAGGTTPFTLATDGTGTVITITAADPEDVPLTYNYSVTSGSLTNGGGTTATVVQGTDSDVNKFTVTPSTTEAYAGTFELTFTASDGINQGTSANSFTLSFITAITNSKYTTLLATATGTSDNNNITDASTNNHSITVNGDAHAGTFSPYRSGGYSTYFDGTNGLMAPTATGTTLQGDTTFTVEFWYNTKTVAAGNKVIWGSRSNTSNTNNDDTIGRMFQTVGSLYYSVNGSTVLNVSSVISANTWYYIALVVDSGAVSLYLDGARIATGTYTSANGSDRIIVGHTANTPQQYIADFRINTAAEYSGTSHTVPTEPLLNTSNTVFHLPTKGYLASDLTLYGTPSPSTKPFSPYDYSEYSATDHGGSINFDGTDDYLTIPDHSSLNFASNDWTIECWIYPRTNVGDCGIWHQSASGGLDWFGLYLDGSFNPKFVLKNNNAEEWAGTAAANTAPQNAWTHIALVRRFGTDIKLYANGKVVHTETQHLNVALENKSYNHIIGYQRYVGSGNAFDGLISDFKIDVGTAHYTAEFTPPTAPLSSTGAELHIKGTDASIIDKSQVNNLKLIGGPTGSTTQTKFSNTKSIDFGDGSLSYVMEVPSGAGYTGEFTIEFWMYNTNTTSTWQTLISNSYVSGSEYFRLYKNDGSGAFALYHNSVSAKLSHIGNITINTWTHVAIVRDSSNDITLYQDGTSIGSYNNSTVFGTASSPINVGKGGVGDSTNYPMSGYIQDLRVTKGLARYTANFTPPTASLEG